VVEDPKVLGAPSSKEASSGDGSGSIGAWGCTHKPEASRKIRPGDPVHLARRARPWGARDAAGWHVRTVRPLELV